MGILDRLVVPPSVEMVEVLEAAVTPNGKHKTGIISEISTRWTTGLRSTWRGFRRTFWPTTPTYAGTLISYEKTRSLYRNDDPKASLGSGICRRIINSSADFIGLPRAASGDEVVDEFLDNCIFVYWSNVLFQMYRNACRDAETIVRIRRDAMDDPLVSPEEWEACYLEIVDPERVVIFYNVENRRIIDKAYIRHEIEMVTEEAQIDGRSMILPQVRQHSIIEEITPDLYRYYDETEGEWLSDLEKPNGWGFVPLREVKNEYESSLEGGQSDFEAAMPFIFALHDVMSQSLLAHKAHSVPKAKFKVNDMLSFLQNNWPDAFEKDEYGRPVADSFNGEISWKGTEILFMQSDEDVEFLEAESVLGESKVLMEFLIDCIAIASETPHSMLMKTNTDIGSDQMVPFTKKIMRKRESFSEDIQAICKMVLSINHMAPIRVPLSWEEITPEAALAKSQALQQDVMSLEVLATREVISDQTVRSTLRSKIPLMKSSSKEALDAKNNKQIEMQSAGTTSPQSVKGTDSGVNE